mmetsp:Transcript_8758/g.18170  ORF Transcript_8758/g.18170 Transcript_8758/m.18170 type:complete len:102 (-) Transcript_8758:342-647(-)
MGQYSCILKRQLCCLADDTKRRNGLRSFSCVDCLFQDMPPTSWHRRKFLKLRFLISMTPICTFVRCQWAISKAKIAGKQHLLVAQIKIGAKFMYLELSTMP